VNNFFNVSFHENVELLSVDGAIRVVSDDFSIALLNPSSELYKTKAEKYTNLVGKENAMIFFSHLKCNSTYFR